MIGIHSVFSNENRGFIYNVNTDISTVELYTWVYSILTWKRDGHPLYLYCDDKINEFVTKYGFGHLYDEIRVRNYDNDIHECFWSYNKIRVIEEFGEPVCLFDVDTFFRDTEFTKLQYDMITYHYELWDSELKDKMFNRKDSLKNLSFYQPVDDSVEIVNGSLLIFNSYDLKTEFLRNAKEVVDTIKTIEYESQFEYDSYTIFMEQVNLGYLNNKYNCGKVSKRNEWGNYRFNGDEPFVHLGHNKERLAHGNSQTKERYVHIIKEKIIELGYPEFGKLFSLTTFEGDKVQNSLIPQRVKPTARNMGDKISSELFTKWYGDNVKTLKDSRFDIAIWGSILGNDIDLIVSTSEGVNISDKDLEEFMLLLHRSGDYIGITVEVLYTNNINYFREFRMENSQKVKEDILIGFVSESDYEPNGELRTVGKLKFYEGPFNDAYYKSTNKHDEVLFIDSVKDIKNNDGYTHFSSEVYNTIYERFGIFSMLG
jgi:hypothetical protein